MSAPNRNRNRNSSNNDNGDDDSDSVSSWTFGMKCCRTDKNVVDDDRELEENCLALTVEDTHNTHTRPDSPFDEHDELMAHTHPSIKTVATPTPRGRSGIDRATSALSTDANIRHPIISPGDGTTTTTTKKKKSSSHKSGGGGAIMGGDDCSESSDDTSIDFSAEFAAALKEAEDNKKNIQKIISKSSRPSYRSNGNDNGNASSSSSSSSSSRSSGSDSGGRIGITPYDKMQAIKEEQTALTMTTTTTMTNNNNNKVAAVRKDEDSTFDNLPSSDSSLIKMIKPPPATSTPSKSTSTAINSNGISTVSAIKPSPTSQAGLIFTRHSKLHPEMTIISKVLPTGIFCENDQDRYTLEGATVLAVNGMTVDNPRHAAEMVHAAKKGQEVQLIVTRITESPRKKATTRNNNNNNVTEAPAIVELKHEKQILKEQLERKKQRRENALHKANELNDPEITAYDSEDDEKDDNESSSNVANSKKNEEENVKEANDDSHSLWSESYVVENAFRKKVITAITPPEKKTNTTIAGTGTTLRRESPRPGSGVAKMLMKQNEEASPAVVNGNVNFNFSAPISDTSVNGNDSHADDGAIDAAESISRIGSRIPLLLQSKNPNAKSVSSSKSPIKKKEKQPAVSPSGIMQQTNRSPRTGKYYGKLPSDDKLPVLSMDDMPALMEQPIVKNDEDVNENVTETADVDEFAEEEEENAELTIPSSSSAKKGNKKKSKSKKMSNFKRAFGLKSKSSAELENVLESTPEASPIILSAEDIMNDLNSLNSNSNKGESKDTLDNMSEEGGGKHPINNEQEDVVVKASQDEKPKSTTTTLESVPEEEQQQQHQQQEPKSALENLTLATERATSFFVESIVSNLSHGGYDSVAECILPFPTEDKDDYDDECEEGEESVYEDAQNCAAGDVDDYYSGANEEEGEEASLKEADLSAVLVEDSSLKMTKKKKGFMSRFKKSLKKSAAAKKQDELEDTYIISEAERSVDDKVEAPEEQEREADSGEAREEGADDAVMEKSVTAEDNAELDTTAATIRGITRGNEPTQAGGSGDEATSKTQVKKSKGFSMFKKSKRSPAKKQHESEETFETVGTEGDGDFEGQADASKDEASLPELNKDYVSKSMEAAVSSQADDQEDNNKLGDSEKTVQAHNKVGADFDANDELIQDAELSTKEDMLAFNNDANQPVDQSVEPSNTGVDALLDLGKTEARKKSSFLKRFKKKSKSAKKKQELEETVLVSDLDNTMIDDQAEGASRPESFNVGKDLGGGPNEEACVIEADEGSFGDDFIIGMDLDETSLGIEVHTPSGRKQLFDCPISPISAMSPSDKLGMTVDVARKGSNNDATVSTEESNSLICENNATVTTPPAVYVESGQGLPPMPPTPTKINDPTKIGESCGKSLLFGSEGAPSPSGSIVGSSPAPTGDEAENNPTAGLSMEGSNNDGISFECRLEDTSAVNICMETMDVGTKRAVEPEQESDENVQPPPTPPPVNRKLFQTDDFGESLCKASFQSRAVDVTTVFRDFDSSYDNMTMETPELQLSRAKQHALTLARRSSRRGSSQVASLSSKQRMTGRVNSRVGSIKKNLFGKSLDDNNMTNDDVNNITLATADVTMNDASMLA